MEDDGIKNKAIQKNIVKRTSLIKKRVCITIEITIKKQLDQHKKRLASPALHGNATTAPSLIFSFYIQNERFFLFS